MKIKLQAPQFEVEFPDDFEIDYEKSDINTGRGNHIVLKKKENKPWRYDETAIIKGYRIDRDSSIHKDITPNGKDNHNIFATELQARSALAMAQISQIMANDPRFGGIVTDEEWDNDTEKYTVCRTFSNQIYLNTTLYYYNFLAFHTKEQRDLFLEENKDLVKDYLMISQ